MKTTSLIYKLVYKLTWFLQGFDVEPHLHAGPHNKPFVLHGQPRVDESLTRLVEHVLLHEHDVRVVPERQ